MSSDATTIGTALTALEISGFIQLLQADFVPADN